MKTSQMVTKNTSTSFLCCRNSAPKLLMHVNLLLFLFNGAGLATAARLKWDPSAYIIVRLYLPTEYNIIIMLLTFGSVTSIIIGLMLVSAIMTQSKKSRKHICLWYTLMMTITIFVELSCVLYSIFHIWQMIDKSRIDDIIGLIHDLKDAIQTVSETPLVSDILNQILSKLAGADINIRDLTKEIIADIPINIVLFMICVIVVGFLQALSVLLALNAAFSNIKSINRSDVKNYVVSFSNPNHEYKSKLDKKQFQD